MDKIIGYNRVHWSGDQSIKLCMSWVCLNDKLGAIAIPKLWESVS